MACELLFLCDVSQRPLSNLWLLGTPRIFFLKKRRGSHQNCLKNIVQNHIFRLIKIFFLPPLLGYTYGTYSNSMPPIIDVCKHLTMLTIINFELVYLSVWWQHFYCSGPPPIKRKSTSKKTSMFSSLVSFGCLFSSSKMFPQRNEIFIKKGKFHQSRGSLSNMYLPCK